MGGERPWFYRGADGGKGKHPPGFSVLLAEVCDTAALNDRCSSCLGGKTQTEKRQL